MSVLADPVTSSGRGLGGAVRDALPLLVSIALLLIGSGLTATLLGVRAGLEGFRPGVIGTVLAGYYLGYVGGSSFAPAAIGRVGHVRVFAGLAGLASAAVLLHIVLIDPVSWFMLRVVVGLCVSALYVVCETWLNGVTTNRSRGSLFAIYMAVVSASLLGGQVLYAVVGARGFEPFVIASVLVSLAVVPVSLSVFPAPAPPRPEPVSVRVLSKVAPLAVVGTAMAGLIGAAMLTAGVVYANQAGFDRGATGAFVGAALAGGVALQVPLGRWSDRVDRRVVIAVAALVAGVVAVVASQVSTDRRLVLIALTAVAGGTAFPIYSLSVAHLNDYIDDDLKVAAGARIVLVNGIGSIIGPVVGSLAIGQISPGSLYLVIAVAYGIVGAHALYRMTRREAAEEHQRADFVPAVVGVGPTTVMGGEGDDGERFPVESGDAPLGDDLVVHYTEQGAGPPVVLVGDVLGEEGDVWDELLRPLAADGFRVVAPSLGTRHESDEAADAVLAVLRHLELGSATFVGYGSGSAVVSDLAVDNADRFDALVLLTDPGSVDEFALGLELGRSTLVIDAAELASSPEDTADDIAEFARPIAATIAVQWETGRFDVVDDQAAPE